MYTVSSTELELFRNLVAHGDAREGKWRGNWRMEWVASTLTPSPNAVYAALLKLMRTHLGCQQPTELTSPTDLNGLVLFWERRNLVSAHVPSRSARAIQTLQVKDKAITLQAWTVPQGSRKFRLPDFKTIGKNKGFSALRSSHLNSPLKIFVVLISVTDWVDPRAVVRPEGFYQWKIPMIPTEIKPATFRLVAQCLNQPRHRVQKGNVWLVIMRVGYLKGSILEF